MYGATVVARDGTVRQLPLPPGTEADYQQGNAASISDDGVVAGVVPQASGYAMTPVVRTCR